MPRQTQPKVVAHSQLFNQKTTQEKFAKLTEEYLKKGSSVGVFLWILWNFSEQPFLQNSSRWLLLTARKYHEEYPFWNVTAALLTLYKNAMNS